MLAQTLGRGPHKGGGGGGGSTPPQAQIVSLFPAPGSIDRPIGNQPKATFDMDMDAATINTTTFTLKDHLNIPVAGTVDYDPALRQAIFHPSANLSNNEAYTATIKGGSSGVKNTAGTPMTADTSWGFTTVPTPQVLAVPVGFAVVAGTGYPSGVTGGEGGTVYDVFNWSDFKFACAQTGTRQILLHGSFRADGNNDTVKITKPNYTIDGSDWTGEIFDAHLLDLQADNGILTELAIRPGEGASAGASADRRAVTVNSGNNAGDIRKRVVWINCSFAWGPDVVASMLNRCEDMSFVRCLFGPCLEESNIASSPNGYGMNVTVPGNSDPATLYARRATFYRCAYILNKQRNLKFEHIDGVDAVNCAVYGWGNQAPVKGNPRHANIINCMFRKCSLTQSSNKAFEPDTGYSQYADSTYQNGNIGLNQAGGTSPGTFALDWSDISGAALRAGLWDGGPTAASHGALSVFTASAAEYINVINEAGRTHQDLVDIAMKNHAKNGTDPGGYYNGAGFPAPHPFASA